MAGSQDQKLTVYAYRLDVFCSLEKRGVQCDVRTTGFVDDFIKDLTSMISHLALISIDDIRIFRIPSSLAKSSHAIARPSDLAEILKDQLSNSPDSGSGQFKEFTTGTIADFLKDDDKETPHFFILPTSEDLPLTVRVQGKNYTFEYKKDKTVSSIVHLLREEIQGWGNVKASDCIFFRFDPPVEPDADARTINSANKALIRNANQSLKRMFPIPPETGYISLLVDTVESKQDEIIESLYNEEPELMKALVIKVGQVGKWTREDVMLESGTDFDVNLEPEDVARLETASDPDDIYNDIVNILSKARTYTADQGADAGFAYLEARVAETIDTCFQPGALVGDTGTTEETGQPVESKNEFEYFARTKVFQEEAARLLQYLEDRANNKGTNKERVSDLLATLATSTFFLPPFLAHQKAGMAQACIGKLWAFSIFIKQGRTRIIQYSPKNDAMLSLNLGLIFVPVVTCEVISDPNQSDLRRMLMQGIPVVRAVNYFLNGERIYFVIAVYITDKLIARRYILYPKKKGERPVSIRRQDFNLCDASDGRKFLLELYNLSTYFKDLKKDIDKEKIKKLVKIKDTAKDLETYTHRSKDTSKGKSKGEASSHPGSAAANPNLDTIPEQLANSLSLDEVTDTVRGWGIDKISALPSHPWIAKAIYDGQSCYLKYVTEEYRSEAEVCSYLTELKETVRNHAVRLIKRSHIRCTGGELLLLADGGAALGRYALEVGLSSSEMLEISRQYFEGVSFLHENGIQHNDLKYGNTVVDESGRVTIIDFGLATDSRNHRQPDRNDTVFDGSFIGTEGWTAPEVGDDEAYSAKRADMWAAGNVIYEFCERAYANSRGTVTLADSKFLWNVCAELMVEEPKNRPPLTTVIDRIVNYAKRISAAPVERTSSTGSSTSSVTMVETPLGNTHLHLGPMAKLTDDLIGASAAIVETAI